ncbi:RPN2 [Hepatospora eriocheir]|uniref:RPN2 n=1 Tax=Hepatospora eriocheir TaxID=1081669 RepID=A0A1X0QK92_9MICR|nr:RPN2 [Hepatospora eriocheir]
MPTEGLVDTVEYYINNNNIQSALELSDDCIERMAVHVKFPYNESMSLDGKQLCTLTKIFLLQNKYDDCISCTIRLVNEYPNILLEGDDLYTYRIVYNLMDYLIINKPKGLLKNFIETFVDKFKPSLNMVGYLFDISLTKLAKEKFIEAIADFSVIELVSFLKKIKQKDECVDLIIGNDLISFERVKTKKYIYDNLSLIYLMVDSLVIRDKDVVSFVNNLIYPYNYYVADYLYTTYRKSYSFANDSVMLLSSGIYQKELVQDFMFTKNDTSFKLLSTISKTNSVYFSFCHSIMNAHTLNDSFFRLNKVINGTSWTKFLELGGLGLIHTKDPFNVLKEILPNDEKSGEPSSLLSLGLITNSSKYYTSDYSGLFKEAEGYFMNFIESQNENYLFGAVLGLCSMKIGDSDQDLLQKLMALYSRKSTHSLETISYGIGLLFAGSNDVSLITQLKMIAQSIDYVRAKRAINVAIGLISDTNNLAFSEKNRDFEEAYLIGLGIHHANTQNLSIIELILPYINNGSDDIKRQAVIALCLVIGYDETLIKELVVPLASNHNLWIRSITATCLGFFSTFLEKDTFCLVVNLLEAMLYDPEQLVVQSACIGVGMILQQYKGEYDFEDTSKINYERILTKLNNFIAYKTETKCVRMGATFGRAIMEIGGRNCITTILNSNNIGVSFERVVGFYMFLHSWYFYPFFNFISTFIQPTPYFLLNELLEQNNTTDIQVNRKDVIVFVHEVKRQKRFRKSKTEKHPNEEKFINSELKSGDLLTMKEKIRFNKMNMFDFY